MTQMLVKYTGDWADEMDVYGFRLTTKENWDAFVRRVHQYFQDENGSYSYYVGTNEEIIYESPEDVLRDFDVEEIADEEAQVITKLFGNYYGDTGPEFA